MDWCVTMYVITATDGKSTISDKYNGSESGAATVAATYSRGLTSTATSYGCLGQGGEWGDGYRVLSATRYTVTARRTLHVCGQL